MVSLDRLDQQNQEAVLAPAGKLSDAMVVDDAGALLAFLDRGEPAHVGAMGCIGYCMGGRHVFLRRREFSAAVPGFHQLARHQSGDGPADLPHLSAENAVGELYCGFGEKDRFTPPTTIHAIESALRGSK